jgi:hypothetical protein
MIGKTGWMAVQALVTNAGISSMGYLLFFRKSLQVRKSERRPCISNEDAFVVIAKADVSPA